MSIFAASPVILRGRPNHARMKKTQNLLQEVLTGGIAARPLYIVPSCTTVHLGPVSPLMESPGGGFGGDEGGLDEEDL